MIQTIATVLHNEMLAPNYGRIALACGEAFAGSKPGQFVMLGFPESIDPLLRRPFSIHRLIMDGSRFRGIELLYKIIGPGTRRLSRQKAGEAISLLGPLGNAFQVPSNTRRLYLAAGGVGVAPMVFLIEWLKTLRRAPSDCRLFLGGRSREDLVCVADVERLGIPVVLTTDDGSCGDQCRVTNPLEEAIRIAPPDLLLACGPKGMLACVLEIVRTRSIPCQVSIETMMACGMGACLGCAVSGRQDPSRYLHACVDGPVFDAEEIEL
jgi:dihydroorotate dehydrogenase electron transfer subunit